MPRDFTTGEVATICQMSQQQIIRCCDKDLIDFYRLPGSRHRRFSREAVEKFIRRNNLPYQLPAAGEVTDA